MTAAHPPSQPKADELRQRIAELQAKNDAAPGWGAAVGARIEEIKGLERQLAALQQPFTGSPELRGKIADILADEINVSEATLSAAGGVAMIDYGQAIERLASILDVAQGQSERGITDAMLQDAALQAIAAASRVIEDARVDPEAKRRPMGPAPQPVDLAYTAKEPDQDSIELLAERMYAWADPAGSWVHERADEQEFYRGVAKIALTPSVPSTDRGGK